MNAETESYMPILHAVQHDFVSAHRAQSRRQEGAPGCHRVSDAVKELLRCSRLHSQHGVSFISVATRPITPCGRYVLLVLPSEERDFRFNVLFMSPRKNKLYVTAAPTARADCLALRASYSDTVHT